MTTIPGEAHPSVTPDFPTFATLARTHTIVPVYRQLLSDTLTPVSAYARLGGGEWSFLFESVVGGEKVGRYSFLGFEPFLKFQAFGDRLRLESRDGVEERRSENPFRDLAELLARYRAPQLPGMPRFLGGAVGYAAYDAVRYLEKLPNAPPDDRQLPDLCFGFYDRMVIFDNIRKVVIVATLARVDPDNPRAAYSAAAAAVDELVDRLTNASDQLRPADISTARRSLRRTYPSNFTAEGYQAAVRRCQEYIRAGDFFQIVPGQRLHADTQAPPFEIYRTLRVLNPSPFMVYMPTPGATLVASSPEIMVRVENGHITTRPLAGTRPRGGDEEEDQRLASELLADKKERAEHVMLVDLGRNDVGRVSEYDSVKLDDLMVVERYSHVMHITSNVSGRLRAGLTPLDALCACLPAGTVSGAPKVRAMQVLDELEPTKRGPYAGAIGYLDFTGNMDTCIALRTMVIVGQRAYVQAGAGIVYDSDPATEYQETLAKARGLLLAVELTEERLGLVTNG